MSDIENNPIIIDIGTVHCRAGFATDEIPSVVFPTVVGTQSNTTGYDEIGPFYPAYVIGEEVLCLKSLLDDSFSVNYPMNLNTINEFMDMATSMNVKIVACTTSMGIMGIKQEELIDNIDIGGVATYLGAATESNVNLFI